MTGLTKEQRFEKAAQLVIMDAIEKGHTDKNEIIAYMSSETFEKAVRGYVALFEEAGF